MTQRLHKWVTFGELPRVSQRLKLVCTRCGRRHAYDVGTVFFDQEGEGESAKHRYAFTKYFRCRDCGSAGPWTIDDYLKMLRLVLRSKLDGSFEGLVAGRCGPFRGTTWGISAPISTGSALWNRSVRVFCVREDRLPLAHSTTSLHSESGSLTPYSASFDPCLIVAALGTQQNRHACEQPTATLNAQFERLL